MATQVEWLEKENDEKYGVSFHTLVFNRRVIQLLAIVILVGIFWWIVSPMFVTQQHVYSCLDETFTQLKGLRSSSVDE